VPEVVSSSFSSFSSVGWLNRYGKERKDLPSTWRPNDAEVRDPLDGPALGGYMKVFRKPL
jgi:hypothetical protein